MRDVPPSGSCSSESRYADPGLSSRSGGGTVSTRAVCPACDAQLPHTDSEFEACAKLIYYTEPVWDVEESVRCVVCPGCAFTFDALHMNDDGSRGIYECPCCDARGTTAEAAGV